jgi:phage shock protein C
MQQPVQQSATPKPLYRSRTNRILGGVCGGIASYFNIDANLVRILFLISGIGIIGYFLCWAIIPEEPISGTRV